VGARAKITTVHTEEGEGFYRISAGHNGFSHGVIHERSVEMREGILLINDTITGSHTALINQFFHLYPGCSVINVDEYCYQINGVVGFTVFIYFDKAVSVTVRASQYAHRFGDLRANHTLTTELTSALPVSLTTRIEWVAV
jgi:hypothetical protein